MNRVVWEWSVDGLGLVECRLTDTLGNVGGGVDFIFFFKQKTE